MLTVTSHNTRSLRLSLRRPSPASPALPIRRHSFIVPQSASNHSKKAADERFKKRGKRPAAASAEETAAKKKKDEEPLTKYQKEVAALSARELKDEGGGRPIMK